jgi:hypothetical protein
MLCMRCHETQPDGSKIQEYMALKANTIDESKIVLSEKN